MRCGIWLCLNENVLAVGSMFRNNPSHWRMTHARQTSRKQPLSWGLRLRPGYIRTSDKGLSRAGRVIEPSPLTGFITFFNLKCWDYVLFISVSPATVCKTAQQTRQKCVLDEGGWGRSKGCKVAQDALQNLTGVPGTWRIGVANCKDRPSCTLPGTLIHFSCDLKLLPSRSGQPLN